jgi:hypothetical protein
MCLYGTYKWVDVINKQQSQRVKVDACIADEIQELNNKGIVTLGCCCGHGEAGKVTEWENKYGKWLGHVDPPNALIRGESVELAKQFGYRPFPYQYSDGSHDNVWQMQLKTGCITLDDTIIWHEKMGLPYKKHLGVIT